MPCFLNGNKSCRRLPVDASGAPATSRACRGAIRSVRGCTSHLVTTRIKPTASVTVCCPWGVWAESPGCLSICALCSHWECEEQSQLHASLILLELTVFQGPAPSQGLQEVEVGYETTLEKDHPATSKPKALRKAKVGDTQQQRIACFSAEKC